MLKDKNTRFMVMIYIFLVKYLYDHESENMWK